MSNSVAIANKPILSRAVEFARKGGDALNALLASTADKKEAAGSAVFTVYDFIMRTYTADELEKLPVPGSKASDSNNPDKWTDKVSKDGQTRDVPRSFYGDAFDATAMGRDIADKLAGLDKVKNGAADAPADLRTMSADDRRIMKDRMNNRKKYGKAALVQSVQIIQQAAKFNELEGITVKLLRDPEGHVKMTPKPIKVFDTENPEDLELYSIATFLSLKPETAAIKGGTMAAIRDTIARTPRGQQTTEMNVKNAGEFDGAMSAVANFLKDVGETRSAKRNAFLKHLNEAGSDDLLKSMQYVYECLDHYLGLPEIAKRVEGLDLADDSSVGNNTEQHAA